MTTVDELFAAMDAPKVDRVILTIDENLRMRIFQNGEV